MLRVVSFLIIITAASPAVVTWRPNTNFNLPINFRDHKLPCSRQTLVFPETLQEAVKIQADVSVKEIVLPIDGEIIFDSGVISIGADEQDNCTEEGNAYYTPRSRSSWLQPDVWSSPKFNEATPDAERIPCYDDEVVFPDKSQFTVLLPLQTQHIRSLNIHQHYCDTMLFLFIVRHLQHSFISSSQQFVLNDVRGTGVIVENKACTSPTGCPCQVEKIEIDCTVKFCPLPKCLDPIQPIGHCCRICGGYYVADISEGFEKLAFEESVAEVINSYGDELVYHVGILPEKRVQVVVVEKDEYSGASARAIHDLDNEFSGRLLKSNALFSGAPLSKAGMGGKIAVGMFFMVVLVMGAIYSYYYKMPQLPEFNVRMPNVMRNSRSVLTRFHRRTDSVVSLTSRRDSTATIRSGRGGGASFRNPLYDSKRGRVEVTESVVEEE